MVILTRRGIVTVIMETEVAVTVTRLPVIMERMTMRTRTMTMMRRIQQAKVVTKRTRKTKMRSMKRTTTLRKQLQRAIRKNNKNLINNICFVIEHKTKRLFHYFNVGNQ